jgi:hypothetical protein
MWDEEYDREVSNWEAEMKSHSILQKEQKKELKNLKADHNALAKEWRNAKFRSCVEANSRNVMKLFVKLPSAMTTSLSVDPENKSVAVEIVANTTEVPLSLMEHVGSLNLAPIKYTAVLNFGTNTSFHDLKVSHENNQKGGVVCVTIEGDARVVWGVSDEVWAVYKNKKWGFW